MPLETVSPNFSLLRVPGQWLEELKNCIAEGLEPQLQQLKNNHN